MKRKSRNFSDFYAYVHFSFFAEVSVSFCCHFLSSKVINSFLFDINDHLYCGKLVTKTKYGGSFSHSFGLF